MIGCSELAVVASPFKSKLRLEAENAVLRHQLIVLRRTLRGRVRLARVPPRFHEEAYLLSNFALDTIAVRGRHNVAASMKKTADVH